MNSQISLLIPAYNAAPFIGNLIADARAQSPQFSEILVYDDASTDSTAEVATSLGVDRVISGKINRGAAHARNQLIEAASCPWVHFHDADDRLDKDYLQIVTAATPKLDEFLFCGMRIYHVGSQKHGPSYEFTHLNGENNLGVFLKNNLPMGCGLYPTESLRRINGFREGIRGGEDFDLHIRLILSGTCFRAIPEVLCTYCRYGNITFTETNLHQLQSDVLTVYEKYLQELPAKYQPVVGELLMEHAYKLYANRQFAEATQAIKLAKSAGRNTVSSSHAFLRLLSGTIGVGPVFRLRSVSNRLRQWLAPRSS
ncbi:glycosyltransferase family A protein [Verrucomicrobium sp. BvORR106]|uniref:glycosyltransferase family 2 protein n=1 Tax=Verrucomicrobium sp. BvORR106 TaxID=1403819 RepID=UPI00056F192C|nr:glycosyltransferase family A protein [Verrucomicrobium sp. BvORR106]